jgi:hypothetical protein
MPPLSSFVGGSQAGSKAAEIEKAVQSATAPAAGSGVLRAPADQQEIRVINQPSVTLTKNTKGFNWEIKAYADNLNAAIDQVMAANIRLKTMYGES